MEKTGEEQSVPSDPSVNSLSAWNAISCINTSQNAPPPPNNSRKKTLQFMITSQLGLHPPPRHNTSFPFTHPELVWGPCRFWDKAVRATWSRWVQAQRCSNCGWEDDILWFLTITEFSQSCSRFILFILMKSISSAILCCAAHWSPR